MYDLDFVDDEIIAACKKQFLSVYGEYPDIIAAADKTCLIAKCNFPDGEFYFRVDENSVSEAFRTMKEADAGRRLCFKVFVEIWSNDFSDYYSEEYSGIEHATREAAQLEELKAAAETAGNDHIRDVCIVET